MEDSYLSFIFIISLSYLFVISHLMLSKKFVKESYFVFKLFISELLIILLSKSFIKESNSFFIFFAFSVKSLSSDSFNLFSIDLKLD